MKIKRSKTQSDEQLVSLLKQGEKKAMSELYKRYYIVVFNKCLSFAKNTDDASDMTHDIMLRIMEKIHSFNGTSKFSTWLYSITFNYCIDQKRKNKGRYFGSIDSMLELSDTSIQEMGTKKDQEEISTCADKVLAKISREDHQLLMMKYLKNKSIQELKEIYKISESAIKMRLMRAREKAVLMLKLELAA